MFSSTKILQVLALEIVLFLPGMLGHNHIDKGAKTLEQYWQETDLRGTELDDLLQNKTCWSDEVSFLACANAVTQVAEKYSLAIDSDGSIRKLTREDVKSRLTEKASLKQWQKVFADSSLRPNFFEVWKKLQARLSTPDNFAYLVSLGMNAYLSLAKDPHSYIIPLAFYEEVIAKNEARQLNLGVVIRRAPESAIVRKVFEGSPAQAAGIQRGDKVLAINNVPVADMLPGVFADALKATDQDHLTFKIERWNHGTQEVENIEVRRTDYLNPSVTHDIVKVQKNGSPHNLGLLVINKFARETCQMSKLAMRDLMTHSIEGLLLDLRDNPGGQVEEAACVINMFVKKNRLLFETRYLNLERPSDRYVSEEDPIYHGPLVVLINSGSASAAEIVGGSLKDLGRATLVGERTFGKGSFQDGRMWEAHEKIAVFETEGLYYFPSGWTPQVVGIEPDIQVNFNDLSQHREAELFFNPIVPKDFWTGPQSLTWLQKMQCEDSSVLWTEFDPHFGEDTQLLKAKEWLFCRSQKSNRTGRNNL